MPCCAGIEARAAGETGRVGLFVGQFHCNALHAPWWRDVRSQAGRWWSS